MERLNVEQLLNDVNKEGYDLTSYQDLKKLKTKDKALVPLLLSYLNSVNYINEKEFFVRCLGVKSFNEATEALINEFKKSDNRAYKWAVGNSLSIIQDKTYTDEYIDIISNQEHGTARQMVILTLGKLRCEKAIPTLIELLNDEEVCGHVVMALGYFKDDKLREYLNPFLDNKESWIRKEAAKSIKKLEKYK